MICSSLCRVPFIAVLLSWVGENSHSRRSSFRGLGQEAGPKQPNLSRLTVFEYGSIRASCSNAKYLEGPAAYDRCLVRELKEWEAGPKQPDVSLLKSKNQNWIEFACPAEFMHGPAAYDRCLIRELKDTHTRH